MLSGLLAITSTSVAQEFLGTESLSVVKEKDIVIYQDANFYACFPSVIRKDDGEIIVAFRRAPERKIFGEKGSNHVDPNSYLVMVRSLDNGSSWSKDPDLIYAHPYGGSQDPCLLKLSNGTLLCMSYLWAFLRPDGIVNLKEPHASNIQGTVFMGGYYLRSEDGGTKWEGPFHPPRIPPEVKFDALGKPLSAYNRGALCEGEDGRIYWIVAASPDVANPKRTANYLLISTDKGLTWTYSCPVANDPEASFNEASIYETPSGDLLAFLRTAGMDDQACIARSTDGGKSFQPWQKMGFQGHPLQAIRLPDNRIFLVYGYRHQPYGIRARILDPEGMNYETAPEIIIRDDGGSTDIGYPWAVLLDENHILVTYYFNLQNGTRHIAGSILKLQE